MSQITYRTADLAFDQSWVSKAALQVVSGLQSAGFDGYLVGGCVRDMLLHRQPKDFDITTNAHPQQVKQLFKRARIIGRRFKIVHVRYGHEVIEVATYRAKPDSAKAKKSHRKPIANSGRLVDDNVFGTIEQDAVRRDFTINSLYYDPTQEQVVDFLGGVKDLRKNLLRIIGNATERFTEDPARMLRALRFRAKLGFKLESTLLPAIQECAVLLDGIPRARLLTEVLKMFHYGHALSSWHELCRYGLLEKLFPLTARLVTAGENEHGNPTTQMIVLALKNTDQRVAEDKPVIAAFLFAVLLWQPFITELARQQRRTELPAIPSVEAMWEAGDVVFRKQSCYVTVPRRVSETVLEIWAMQFELEQRLPKAVPILLTRRRFRAAYDFLLLRQQVGEVDAKLAKWWTDIQES